MAQRWFALLRAVNVGGANRLPMADFRAALESLGAADVTTYVQSGNAVYTASRDLGAELASRLGVGVVARPAARLDRIVSGNPFADATAEPKTLHVGFLSTAPATAAAKALEAQRDRFPPDEFVLRGDVLYLRYPNGLGRSKMSHAFFERTLGVRVTIRNWNTVTKLLELSRG